MKFYHRPQKLEAIIFDIDSTLYTNTEYAFQQNDVQIRHYARLEGIGYREALAAVQATRHEWSGKNGGRTLSLGNTFVLLGYPIEQSIRWREELLEPARFLTKDRTLILTLEQLARRFKLACVTNNPVLTGRKTLAALGVEELFPIVIGLDTCRVSKPHPAPFLLALEKLACPAGRCLSVGDRHDIDIAPSLELGMGGLLVDGVEELYQLPFLLT